MEAIDYIDLQRQYGGRYVALRAGEVVLSAESYDRLIDELDELERRGVPRRGLRVAYIDSPDVIAIY